MAVGEQSVCTVPTAVERFVKQLVITYKAVMLYPPSSAMPRESGDVIVEILHDLFAEDPELRIAVSKEGFQYEDLEVFPGHAAYTTLAQTFYHRGVADMRFHSGVTGSDVVALLGLLRVTPMDIIAAGGFAAQLWDAGVVSITVTESRVQILEDTMSEAAEEQITAEDVERVLQSHAAGRPVEHRLLVRVATDSGAVRSYLEKQMRSEEGLDGEKVREMAHLAASQPLKDRPALVRALADAIEGLDPRDKRALVAEHVLPGARHDDALAAVIRQMDVDAVCRMLVEELEGGEASREGVARALRNLALISMADRGEVMNAAGAAMRGIGLDEETVGSVMELANPSVLTVRDAHPGPVSDERPVDTVFKLMDLAPLTSASHQEDPDFAELEVEARHGIADADVLHALVTLVTVDPDSDRWAAVMAMLESSLELIVSRGEFDIAADIAQQLQEAGEDERFSIVQRTRLTSSVGLLARLQDVRTLANAMRVYDADTAEYAAATRLLHVLRDRAIGPLLSVLADEEDGATRKALVELLSGLAADHIARIGEHILDPRWYFVRNVVTVLGAPRSPAALTYLGRTARHPDARVRRETIRALAGIPDRVASELLVTLLSDEDAQNVQLAARQLGKGRVRGAVPVLMQVARGEGKGNRDTASRIEAIEALGQIGSPEALTVLESLTRRRALVGAARSREVKSAAEAAVSRIATVGGVR